MSAAVQRQRSEAAHGRAPVADREVGSVMSVYGVVVNWQQLVGFAREDLKCGRENVEYIINGRQKSAVGVVWRTASCLHNDNSNPGIN